MNKSNNKYSEKISMPILLDIKYAIRLLLNTPKFTALTLFVLVGGLSISLFTFSFLYSFLYKPLPLPEGDSISRLFIGVEDPGWRIPAYEFLQVREQLDSFSEMGVYESVSVRLSIGESGKTIHGTFAEQDIFRFTKTNPILGRGFNSQDMQPSSPAVVVISHYIWQNEFNADPDIINKEIRLNDVLTNVIGVMPEGYGFPVNSRLWLPIPTKRLNPLPESNNWLNAYARVKTNKSQQQAELEINNAINKVYQQTAKLYQKEEGKLIASLQTFPQAQTDGDGNLIFTFFNLIGFSILLLACINTGNLLLARAIKRQKETAIRAALGAPIHRLTLQLMWEGIIITLTGTLLSVLLVADLLDYTETALHSSLSNGMPFWWHWGMDKETLLVALAYMFITLLLASFIPAWRSANQDINNTLRDGTRGAQGKKAGKMTRLLVTVQIFIISILMLIGSVSAVISHFLINIDNGEDYTQVILGRLYLPEDKYPQQEQQLAFFETFVERLKQKGNVEEAVVVGYLESKTFSIEGDADEQQKGQLVSLTTLIGNTDFYSAKLISGRRLDARDNANAQKTVLINQSIADTYWPNGSPIGQRISVEIHGQQELLMIVGVVSNLFNEKPLIHTQDTNDRIYLSGLQFPNKNQAIFYRYSGKITAAEESFYQVLFSLDRNIEPDRLEPAERNMELMRKAMQLTSNITFATGGFALLLALTGIYGLTSNTISQRSHEIGVRRAVGALDNEIITMFLKQGSKQLLIGLGFAVFLFGLLGFAFNQLSGGNIPALFYFALASIVSLFLSVVVLAAIYIPTKKAVAIEPSDAMRYE